MNDQISPGPDIPANPYAAPRAALEFDAEGPDASLVHPILLGVVNVCYVMALMALGLIVVSAFLGAVIGR